MTVNVLGTNYNIIIRKYDEDELFKKNSWSGYCNEILKEIVVCDMSTYPGFEDGTKEEIELTQKQILRHEITHAFLDESGLSFSSLQYSGGWAKNEEMVDWFAIQGEKIYKAWESVNAI